MAIALCIVIIVVDFVVLSYCIPYFVDAIYSLIEHQTMKEKANKIFGLDVNHYISFTQRGPQTAWDLNGLYFGFCLPLL